LLSSRRGQRRDRELPTIDTLSPAFNTFKQVPFYPKELALQYVQTSLLSVQRTLPASHVVELGYTQGYSLELHRDMNAVPTDELNDPSNTGKFSPSAPSALH
jgi:hypothetical protein